MRDHFAHEIGQRFAIEAGASDPAHPHRRVDKRRHARNKDDEFEREMREYMAHDAGNALPRDLLLPVGKRVGMRSGWFPVYI